ncbi:MAG: DNA cytosine methyltransferase [Pantoea vagans]|nr:DNA cytosine methyltransferase [Pantoea vagans]
MNELALFAGAGGGVLGSHLLGWRTICAVERDAYAAQVLAQRQNDGSLPPFPIWSDVCSFDGRPWRNLVDVVSGGFPCQDISVAGSGIGIAGPRSSLWSQMARIIGEVRPGIVALENSPMLVGRGLALVVSELAEMGYGARWCVLGAADLGAPHQRYRVWLVAFDNKKQAYAEEVADACRKHGQGTPGKRAHSKIWSEPVERPIGSCRHGARWWAPEPGMGRVADGVADGVAYRVDRLKALGNGQVPRVAAGAFSILSDKGDS